MDEGYKGMIHNLAERLRTVPYDMARGADALDSWVDGTYIPGPLHNIPCCSVRRAACDPLAALTSGHGFGNQARPFESEVLQVSIKSMSDNMLAAMNPVSEQGKFIALMTRGLMRDHNFEMGQALDLAKRCWRTMPPCYRPFATGSAVPSTSTDLCGEGAPVPLTENDEADGHAALAILP